MCLSSSDFDREMIRPIQRTLRSRIAKLWRQLLSVYTICAYFTATVFWERNLTHVLECVFVS